MRQVFWKFCFSLVLPMRTTEKIQNSNVSSLKFYREIQKIIKMSYLKMYFDISKTSPYS